MASSKLLTGGTRLLQSPDLQNRHNEQYLPIDLTMRIKWIKTYEAFGTQVLACSKYSVDISDSPLPFLLTLLLVVTILLLFLLFHSPGQ